MATLTEKFLEQCENLRKKTNMQTAEFCQCLGINLSMLGAISNNQALVPEAALISLVYLLGEKESEITLTDPQKKRLQQIAAKPPKRILPLKKLLENLPPAQVLPLPAAAPVPQPPESPAARINQMIAVVEQMLEKLQKSAAVVFAALGYSKFAFGYWKMRAAQGFGVKPTPDILAKLYFLTEDPIFAPDPSDEKVKKIYSNMTPSEIMKIWKRQLTGIIPQSLPEEKVMVVLPDDSQKQKIQPALSLDVIALHKNPLSDLQLTQVKQGIQLEQETPASTPLPPLPEQSAPSHLPELQTLLQILQSQGRQVREVIIIKLV